MHHIVPWTPEVGREGRVIITLPKKRLDDLTGSRDSLITFNKLQNITLSNERITQISFNVFYYASRRVDFTSG